MILFLLDSGERFSELVNLKHPDVDLKTGRAKILVKGVRERFVYFGGKTKKALWRYISITRPEPMSTITNLFLFVDGRPMKNRRIGHILSNLGEKAKVEDVHAHRFRRTAAVQFIRNGVSIFAF